VLNRDADKLIALNAAAFNSARVVGPSIAGVLISAVGEGYCFLIDSVSYLAVIASLLLMRLPAKAVLPPPVISTAAPPALRRSRREEAQYSRLVRSAIPC